VDAQILRSYHDNSSSSQLNSIILSVATEKTATELARITGFTNATKGMIEPQAISAFAFGQCHLLVSHLSHELMKNLTPSLVKPFQELNTRYNQFYSAFGRIIGNWSAVCKSQQHVLPKCVAQVDQFKALCKIISVVIKDTSVDMKPIKESLLDATTNMGNAIIEIQGAVNHINGLKGDELLKEAKEIESLKDSIERNLLSIQQAEAQKNFLEFNSDNNERQLEYLKSRVKSINTQLEEIDRLIQENLKKPDQIVVKEKWLFFTWTTTSDINKNPIELKQRKDTLIEEREKVESTINNIRQNRIEQISQNILTDISVKNDNVQRLKEELKTAEENYRKKKDTLLASLLLGQNVPNRVAIEMADILNLLNLVLVKATILLSELDAMQLLIKSALDNETLQPANILGSIASVFQFTVMFEILNTESLQLCANPCFNENYAKFIGEQQNMQIYAIEAATPGFVQKQDEEAAKKKARLAAAGWV